LVFQTNRGECTPKTLLDMPLDVIINEKLEGVATEGFGVAVM